MLNVSAPKRLYPLRFHAVQDRLKNDPVRFKVVPAGRRSGKTEIGKRKVVREVLRPSSAWDDPRYFAAAPTRDQAKAIYWNDLKAMVPPAMIDGRPSESHLMMQLRNGAELWVLGMDKPERIEGRPWDGGLLDEYANMKPRAWGENVRPALSDRKGWCWLLGVPEGRNHYYDINQYALSGVDPDWASYTWKSIDILDAAEVEAARRQLDPLTFEQEYEASFVNFAGRAYYGFDSTASVSTKLTYDPRQPLIVCFDFNVAPGVAVIAQEQPLPGEYERDALGLPQLDRPIIGTGIIGEVHIPLNSNTPAVVRRVLSDYAEHTGTVHCYGDATGGASGTAKVSGSDWDLIKAGMRNGYAEHGLKGFGVRVYFDVPAANPPERTRVNSVNTRLQNGVGERRIMVHPARAPHVVKDFEGVRVLDGGAGELDKASDPTLTHYTDAFGYYVVRKFPLNLNTPTATALRA